ncbi:uncharacterized protein [Physcomitrium patens]|uniref:Uncharacterized protein n=1 Tax=Physcomitrium patens TaxID=3218 RepID=A0A2K1KMG6_PHYPA|nr:uncharacterized protein LOC112281923 isoform X2 [Physcomitrium patens]PNR54980.1 hypothetical protein PHYPA_005873 [Physcomitrium patens]|eukprot:XP_024374727.1 uncharacterized protein LOC112281923 isoform X2 [Physcomitrella patens]
MYSPGRGDARATALPNARDSSTSMPIDHSSAWQREPYNRDVRLDRGDRERTIGGKREWNSDRASPGAPYQRGFGGLHPVNGYLGPPSKRRLNGRHIGFHAGNGRYGSAGQRGEPSFGSFVPLENGLAPKFEQESFYLGSGRPVVNTGFSSGPGLDYRSKELGERQRKGSFLTSGDGRDGGSSGVNVQHVRLYPSQVLTEVENTSWERERPKGQDGNGWESSQRSEREHRERLLGKAESFSRREGRFSQFEEGRERSQVDKDSDGSKLDRCGSSSWDRCSGDTMCGSKVSANGFDWRRKERSTSVSASRNASNGCSKESVVRPPVLDVSGSPSSPQLSLRSTPSALVEVSRDDGNHPSPAKRPRLGWGQGLAKYEKKNEVVETDDIFVSGSVDSASGSKRSSVTAVSGVKTEVVQMLGLQAAEESSVSVISKLSTLPLPKVSSSPLQKALESVSKSSVESRAVEEVLGKACEMVADEAVRSSSNFTTPGVRAEDLVKTADVCALTECSLELSVRQSYSWEPVEKPTAWKESNSCQASPTVPCSVEQCCGVEVTQEVCSTGDTTWWSKEDILQRVEKLESEIEQVERELSTSKRFGSLRNDTHMPVPEIFENSANADLGTKLEPGDYGPQVLADNAVSSHAGSMECRDSSQLILVSFPNRICSVSAECISHSVSSLETGAAVGAGPPMCNQAMGSKHRNMENEVLVMEEWQSHEGEKEATSDQTMVESEGEGSLVSSPSAEVYLPHMTLRERAGVEVRVSKSAIAKMESSDAAMVVGDVEAVARGLIGENKDQARHASEAFLHLLSQGGRGEGKVYSCPVEAPVWKENVERHVRNQEKMLEKIAERRQSARFVEQVLTIKFRALKDAWRQEQFGTSQQQRGTKPVRRWEAEKRGGTAGCHRSSLRLRPVQAGGGKLEAQSEESMKRVMVEPVVGPLRPALKMPAMILGERERLARRFESNNALVEDPVRVESERKSMNPWSAEERRVFLEKFAVYNKNFSKIASHLEYKTTADCVEFYCRNQKSEDFEKIRRRQQLQKRRDCSRLGGSFLSTGLQPNSRQREANIDARSEGWNMQTSGAVSTVCQITVGAKAARSSTHHKPLERQRTSSSLDPGSLPAVVEIAKSTSGKESRPSGIPPLPSGAAGSGTTGSCSLSSATAASVKVSRERTSVKSNWNGGSAVARSGTKEQQMSGPKGARSVNIRRGLTTSAGEETDAQWTDKERELFTEAVRLFRRDFESIAAHVGSTKSEGQCKSFFSKTRKRLRLDQLVEKHQAALNFSADAAVAESPECIDVQMEEVPGAAAEVVLVASLEANIYPSLGEEKVWNEATESGKVEEVANDVSIQATEAVEAEMCEDIAAEKTVEEESCEDVVVAKAVEEGLCEGVAIERAGKEEIFDNAAVHKAVEEVLSEDVKVEMAVKEETVEDVAIVMAVEDALSEVVSDEKAVEEVLSEDLLDEKAMEDGSIEEKAGEDGSIEEKAGEDGSVEVKTVENEGVVRKAVEHGAVKDVVVDDETVDDVAEEGVVGVIEVVETVDFVGVSMDLTVESAVCPLESPDIVENLEKAEADVGAGACSMNECDTGEAEDVVAACIKAEPVVVDEGVVSEPLTVDAGEELPAGNSSGSSADCGMQEEGDAVEVAKGAESVVESVKREVDAGDDKGLGTVVATSILASEEQIVEASGAVDVKHQAGSPQMAVSTGTESGSCAIGAEGACHSGKAAYATTSSMHGSQQCREKSGRVGSGEAKSRREPTSWTQEEKEVFADIIRNHGKDWTRLHECLPTKSLTQIKTYFQNSKAKLGLVNSEGVSVGGGRGSGSRKRKAEEVDNMSNNVGCVNGRIESKCGSVSGGDVDGGGQKVKGGMGDPPSMSVSAGMGTIPVGLEGLAYPFFGQRVEDQMALHQFIRQLQLCNPNGFPQNIPPMLHPLLQQQGLGVFPDPGLQRAGPPNLQQQFAASMSQKTSQSMGLQLALQGPGVGQQSGAVDLHQQGAHQLLNSQAARSQQQLLANMMQQQAAAQLQQQQHPCSKSVVHSLQQAVLLQPGQVAQRQQQQLMSPQVVHHSQAHQAGGQHQQYQALLQHQQFQQTVQHFQQQQDHVQAQALIHQHHSSHAPLPPSLVSSSKSIAVMPLPQHLSKIPLAPVLQQGIAVHEERNGAGVTSSRVNEGSAGSSHCEDASIQQVESGELRGSCSNGGPRGQDFSRAEFHQLSGAVQRAPPSQTAVPLRPSPISATESPQTRPGDVKLFGQSLLSQPTCSAGLQSAARAAPCATDKVSLQQSPVHTMTLSSTTGTSVPAATVSKVYGSETSFGGMSSMSDGRQSIWPSLGNLGSIETRNIANGMHLQAGPLWKSKERESKLHNMQESRMFREARDAEPGQSTPTNSYKLQPLEHSRNIQEHSRSEGFPSLNNPGFYLNEQGGGGGFSVSSVEASRPELERRNESSSIGSSGCERGPSTCGRSSRGQMDSFAMKAAGLLANGPQVPRTMMNSLMAVADLHQSRSLLSGIGSPRLEDHQCGNFIRQAANGAAVDTLKADASVGLAGPLAAPQAHLSGGDLLQQCVRDSGMYFTQHYSHLADHPGVSPGAWYAGTGLMHPSDVQRMLVNPALNPFLLGALSRAPSAAEEHLGSIESRDPDNGGSGLR